MRGFDEVREALQRAGMDPAEAHGLLCGLLCSPEGATAEQWLARVFELAPAQDAGDDITELQVLYEETVQQLADPEFGLRLLLPADEEPLALRSEALAHWSQGFLYGLALAPDRPLERLCGPVCEEVSRDLAGIAALDSAAVREDNEEDEQAYAELVEYVRAGALLVYEELHQPPAE